MIEIEFYNFSKKSNSTARPNNGTVISCELKRETTFQSPSFLIRYDMNDFLSFNYCKWKDHYYFINEVTSINANQIEVSCREDVLATYKEEIGNYTCFIERSSKQNKLYPDAMYLPTEDWQSTATIVGEPLNTFVNGYFPNFIIRTTASDGINLYYMTNEEMNDLLKFMWSDGTWKDLISDAWMKLFFDPFKYILSVEWTPLRLSAFKSFFTTVHLGFWDSGVNGNQLGGTYEAPTVKFSYDLSFSNPLYDPSDFRYWNSNFSRYAVKIPFIGVINIDITKTNKGQLVADYFFDAASGLCDVWLASGQNKIAHYQFSLSVPIEIGYANTNMTNLIGNTTGAVANVASGNIIGSITSGLSAIQNVTSPEVSVIGSTGTIAGVLENKDASSICYTRSSTVVNGVTDGYADGHTRKLNSLSGFIKCRNASVSINGYSGDQESVNMFLNTGFYYE